MLKSSQPIQNRAIEHLNSRLPTNMLEPLTYFRRTYTTQNLRGLRIGTSRRANAENNVSSYNMSFAEKKIAIFPVQSYRLLLLCLLSLRFAKTLVYLSLCCDSNLHPECFQSIFCATSVTENNIVFDFQDSRLKNG